MQVPKFETIGDVKLFLNQEGDTWCRPMVEEFIEMCGSDLDVHELNGWLQDEMKSLTEGYEDYYDN